MKKLPLQELHLILILYNTRSDSSDSSDNSDSSDSSDSTDRSDISDSSATRKIVTTKSCYNLFCYRRRKKLYKNLFEPLDSWQYGWDALGPAICDLVMVFKTNLVKHLLSQILNI